jgi:hypothetical protein
MTFVTLPAFEIVMRLIEIAGIIYFVGIMFVVCWYLYGLSDYLAKSSKSEVLKLVKKIPSIFFILIFSALTWPVLLFKNTAFREAVVNCGMIAMPFGYFGAVLLMFGYPMIWVWYIIAFALWGALTLFHRRHAQTSELAETKTDAL